MKYRPLGRTGVMVSEYCLGAMMYGQMGNPDHDDCIRQIHKSLDAGVNFIDTADVYSLGESEEIVGQALKGGRRENVILATKFFAPMGEDLNQQGGSRRWIMQEVENSLCRLDTDYIDLYQVHRFPDNVDIEETLSAFTDLQAQGKIRYAGSSEWPVGRIVEAQWASDRHNLIRYRCEQAQYNLFTRRIEREVLPACQRYGMGVILWSPLAGGWLTGRYRSAGDFTEESRIVRFAERWGSMNPESELNQRKLALVGDLSAIADQAGLSLTHLAVAWTLEHPAVTSTIIGPRTHEQLDDLLACAEVVLDEDTLDAIDALLPPGTNLNPSDPSSEPAEMGKDQRRQAHR